MTTRIARSIAAALSLVLPAHAAAQVGSEWAEGRKQGHKDKPGDDDVDIVLQSSGSVSVEYRS